MNEVREPANRNPYLAPKAPVMDSKIDGRGAQPAARSRSTAGDRILAFLLVVGGIAGIGISLYMATLLVRTQWIYGVIAGPLVVLFAWSVLTGFRLWRGQRRGLSWAAMLFAMQIPILSIPGFGYEYYTGFSLKIMGSHVDKPVSISVGATGNLQLFDPRATDTAYGLNLFALAATTYLLTRRRTIIKSGLGS